MFLDVVVQPERLQLSCQYDRHPVMDGSEQVLGCRRDDRARPDGLVSRVRPHISQTRECEGLSRCNRGPHGPSACADRLPLVEPVSEHQASSPSQHRAEAGPLGDRLRPGVYYAVPHCRGPSSCLSSSHSLTSPPCSEKPILLRPQCQASHPNT